MSQEAKAVTKAEHKTSTSFVLLPFGGNRRDATVERVGIKGEVGRDSLKELVTKGR